MSKHGEPETGQDKDDPPAEGGARHAAAEGAEVHPLIDLKRDPTPGVPDHAKPGEDEE